MNPEITSTHRPVDKLGRSPLLGRIASAIQPTLRAWFEGDDAVHRPIKDLVHGTFLGHALHPLLTDVPIGAWTVTALCDVLEVGGVRSYREAADVSLTVGISGAFAAAVTGLADWSDTKDEPQRLGLLHGMLNTAALACYAVSLGLRKTGRRRPGIALALTGFGIVSAAAYLGGELSLGMQLGTKHTAVPIEPPNTFVGVCDDGAVREGAMKAADPDRVPVLLTRQRGVVHAVGGVCTHRGAPLADGTYKDGCVRCPWHGSRFALDDGRVVEGPATFPLAEFETRVTDGVVAIRPHR